MPLLFLCPPPAALGRLKRAATTTPTPNPFLFFFFGFGGQATGRTGGAPPRLPVRVARRQVPVGARDGAAPGPWVGENKLRAVCNTADHGGPRVGASAKECTRQRDERGGKGPTPMGKGRGGTHRECPRISWDGGAAKPLPCRSLDGGSMIGGPRVCGPEMMRGCFGHGRTRAPMLHRGDVVPCGWWSGDVAGDVTEAPGPARRMLGPGLRWAEGQPAASLHNASVM
jgi:hypothetical protein